MNVQRGFATELAFERAVAEVPALAGAAALLAEAQIDVCDVFACFHASSPRLVEGAKPVFSQILANGGLRELRGRTVGDHLASGIAVSELVALIIWLAETIDDADSVSTAELNAAGHGLAMALEVADVVASLLDGQPEGGRPEGAVRLGLVMAVARDPLLVSLLAAVGRVGSMIDRWRAEPKTEHPTVRTQGLGQLPGALPSELMLLRSPRRMEVLRRHLERRVSRLDRTTGSGIEVDGPGPLEVLLDGSSSMAKGNRAFVAKTIALAILVLARSEHRRVRLTIFCSPGREQVMSPPFDDTDMRWIARFEPQGGTDVAGAIMAALDDAPTDADFMVVSDGELPFRAVPSWLLGRIGTRRIHVVSVLPTMSRELRALAEATGGNILLAAGMLTPQTAGVLAQATTCRQG